MDTAGGRATASDASEGQLHGLQDPQYDPSECCQHREIEQEQGKHPQSILRRLLAHLGLVRFDTLSIALSLSVVPFSTRLWSGVMYVEHSAFWRPWSAVFA